MKSMDPEIIFRELVDWITLALLRGDEMNAPMLRTNFRNQHLISIIAEN